jgi:hypothetical protein
MAELKTQPTDASVDEFLSRAAGGARRKDCDTLVAMMRAATGVEPRMWGTSMVGFGRYRYRYQSGREGEWPLIGFSPRKNDLTLYIMAGFERFDELMRRLGRYRTGMSCLYLKKLADVDLAVLQELIGASVAHMAEQRVE